MKQFKQHYKAIVSRGKITPDTKVYDFLIKLDEEIEELWNSYNTSSGIESFDENEVIDVIAVAVNMLIHKGFDVVKLYDENVKKQLNRKD